MLASNWPSFGALLSVTEKGLETGMEEDWVPTPAKELTCLGAVRRIWEAIDGGTGSSYTPFLLFTRGCSWTDPPGPMVGSNP